MGLRIAHKIHVVTGIGMLIFFVIIALSGLLLLHSEKLLLGSTPLSSYPLLWLYGEPQTYKIGEQIIEEEYPPTWEKALTLLHRGVVRGESFSLLVDICGIALLLLAFSGSWLLSRKFIAGRIIGAESGEAMDDFDYLAFFEELRIMRKKRRRSEFVLKCSITHLRIFCTMLTIICLRLIRLKFTPSGSAYGTWTPACKSS